MADLDALYNTPGLKRVDEVSLEEFKRHRWLNEDISILRWLFIIADQVRALKNLLNNLLNTSINNPINTVT